MNIRAYAVKLLQQVVVNRRSLGDVLSEKNLAAVAIKDQPFVKNLCYGVCRFYYQLDASSKQLIDKPLRAKDTDVYLLILLGLLQLQHLNIPTHAAVSETVQAADALKKTWAKGFVNGVLRRFIRNPMPPQGDAQYAHPPWLLEHLQKAWPAHWRAQPKGISRR